METKELLVEELSIVGGTYNVDGQITGSIVDGQITGSIKIVLPTLVG
ncbi:MAG: hypothetical protein R2772_07725 [Chitinophagales bacterium]